MLLTTIRWKFTFAIEGVEHTAGAQQNQDERRPQERQRQPDLRTGTADFFHPAPSAREHDI